MRVSPRIAVLLTASLLLLGLGFHALPSSAQEGIDSAAAAEANADSDGDGITDAKELALGTNPHLFDTDCDSLSDSVELYDLASPLDSDGDGLIDARESRISYLGVADQYNPILSTQITCFQATPFAVADDGIDTARLEVRIEAPVPPSAVYAGLGYDSLVLLDGQPIDDTARIDLYDDGTHGDRRANDKIWTRGGITAASIPPEGDYPIRGTTFSLTVENDGVMAAQVVADPEAIQQLLVKPSPLIAGEDRVFGLNGSAVFFVVRSSAVAQPRLVNPNLQILSHVANIVDGEGEASVDPDFYWEAAARAVYTHFADEFDFLIFQTQRPYQDNLAGIERTVSNTVKSIGEAPFPILPSYGSAGKLQSIIWLNSYHHAEAHEFMHRWAVPNLNALGFQQCLPGWGSNSGVAGHWGVVGNGMSVLGGFDPATMVDEGDGTYRVKRFAPASNDVARYAPLELYLAGLIPASEVPPITVPTNAGCFGDPYSGRDQITADGFTTVTMQQIQETFGGPREPSNLNAQKAFRAGYFVVSDRLLTAAELSFFNIDNRDFGDVGAAASPYSFRALTGNRATLDTRMIRSTSNGVDAWVSSEAQIHTTPGSIVTVPVEVGNSGAAASGPLTVTLSVDARLTYLDDTFAVTPTLSTASGKTLLTWRLPGLDYVSARGAVIHLEVPASASNASFALAFRVQTSGDTLPANNTTSSTVLISTFSYLPVVQRASAPTPTPPRPTPAPTPAPGLPAGKIYFADDSKGNFEIYSIRPDGTGLAQLTRHPGRDTPGTVSPDGKTILFTTDRVAVGGEERAIYSMNSDGSAPTLWLLRDLWLTATDYSPDGTKVLLNYFINGFVVDMWVANADGSNPVPLVTAQKFNTGGSWSPDGSRIVFTSNRDGNFDLYTMNADGSGVQRLYGSAGSDSSPIWSADGGHIFFTGQVAGRWHVLVINSNGSGMRDLTNAPYNEALGGISPDGKWLVFTSDRDGQDDVYIMKTDGSGVSRVTNTPSDEASPAIWGR